MEATICKRSEYVYVQDRFIVLFVHRANGAECGLLDLDISVGFVGVHLR